MLIKFKLSFDSPSNTFSTFSHAYKSTWDLITHSDLYVNCVEMLQESMQAEGKLLASTPYGAKILEVLGSIYTLQAEMVLGGQSPSLFQDILDFSLASHLGAVSR